MNARDNITYFGKRGPVFLRSILTFCVVLGMMLGIVACSGDIQQNQDDTEMAMASAEAGSWKISGVGIDETEITVEKLSVQCGAQIAIDEINVAGGMNGFMVEFSYIPGENRFGLIPAGTELNIVAYPANILLGSSSVSFDADTADEALNQFAIQYEQMFGAVPDQMATAAYRSVYRIKSALEQSDVTPDMSMDDICLAMKEVMADASVD